MSSPSVLWPRAEFSYQTTSSSDALTCLLGRCHSHGLMGFSLERYLRKDATGHREFPTNGNISGSVNTFGYNARPNVLLWTIQNGRQQEFFTRNSVQNEWRQKSSRRMVVLTMAPFVGHLLIFQAWFYSPHDYQHMILKLAHVFCNTKLRWTW